MTLEELRHTAGEGKMKKRRGAPEWMQDVLLMVLGAVFLLGCVGLGTWAVKLTVRGLMLWQGLSVGEAATAVFIAAFVIILMPPLSCLFYETGSRVYFTLLDWRRNYQRWKEWK